MCRFHKVFNYEYWPWYIWHLIALPVHIYNAIKCRTLVYFTTLNPVLGVSSGFFGDSKLEMNKLIPEKYKLNEIIVNPEIPFEKQLADNGMMFPVVLKPEAGERGEGVTIIQNNLEAQQYLITNAKNNYGIIAQSFCELEQEYGVFMVNHPKKGWLITGLTGKIPFQLVGDGKSTVGQMLNKSCRYKMQISRIAKENRVDFNVVLKVDEVFRVDSIMNHRLGAEFINCTHFINEEIRASFKDLCQSIIGFNYGRFDAKAGNLQALKNGDFKVIEINGAASEPTIMYDQKRTGLFGCIKIVLYHVYLQGFIAKNQLNEGVPVMDWTLFRRTMSSHFKLKWL